MLILLTSLMSSPLFAGNNSREIIEALIPKEISSTLEAKAVFDFSKKIKMIPVHNKEHLKSLALALADCLNLKNSNALCGATADSQSPYFDSDHTDAHQYLIRALELSLREKMIYHYLEIKKLIDVGTSEIQSLALNQESVLSDAEWSSLDQSLKDEAQMAYYTRILSDKNLSLTLKQKTRSSMHKAFQSKKQFVNFVFSHQLELPTAGIHQADLKYLCVHYDLTDQKIKTIFNELRLTKYCRKTKS